MSTRYVGLIAGVFASSILLWDLRLFVISVLLGFYWFAQPIVRSYFNFYSPEAVIESYFEDGSLDPAKRQPFELLVSNENPGSVSLSVIVPAYKEEKRLPKMLDETIGYLQDRCRREQNFSWEIIVVDDGSPDNTFGVAHSYSAKYGTNFVRVLKLAKNHGKGGAVKKGMLRARGKLLLMADADGATKFSDIERLEEAMNRFSSEFGGVVVGSRAHLLLDDSKKRKGLRGFVSESFQVFVSLLVPGGVRDSQCGFKLFSRKAARLIFPLQKFYGWAFDCELLFLARKKFKLPISEISVNWVDVDGSKLNVTDASLEMARDILLMSILYGMGFW